MARVLPAPPAGAGSPCVDQRNGSTALDVPTVTDELRRTIVRSWADLKLSGTLLLLPLSVIGLWLLVPLHSLSECDQPEMQDPYLYLFLWRPLYIAGALAMGVAMFDVMVPRPPVKYLVESIFLGAALDTALCTYFTLRLDSRVSSEQRKLRLIMYGSLTLSTMPPLCLYVLHTVFRVRHEEPPRVSQRQLHSLTDADRAHPARFDEATPANRHHTIHNDAKEVAVPRLMPSKGSRQNNLVPTAFPLPGAYPETEPVSQSRVSNPSLRVNNVDCVRAIDSLRAHDAASLHTSSWSSHGAHLLPMLPATVPRPTVPHVIDVQAVDGTPLRRKKRRTSLFSQRVDADARRHSHMHHRQLSKDARRAAIKHDILQLVIITEVAILIIATYFSCIVFSVYFQNTTEEQTRVVLSFFFMVVLIPLVEMLMKIIIRQQATDTVKGLVLHIAMKFVMDMFYFVYYRTLFVTRFTLLTSMVIVEFQSALMEFVRYPFRVTRWYLRHEELLKKLLGQHRQWGILLLSAIILVGSNAAILLRSQGSMIVGLAYVGSMVGAVGVRVGLNVSDEPPAVPDDDDGTTVPQPGRQLTLPRPHVSVEEDAELFHDAPKSSYARVIHAVNSLEGLPQLVPNTPSRTTSNSTPPTPIRRILTVTDKQEAKLRDFQRLHAAEHFIRKKARELAIFGYLLYVPLLHGGYNVNFWPFGSEDDFNGHSMELLWQFGIILVVLHVTESFISRIVFNRSVGMDTFTDAVSVVRPMKVRILIILSAIHIMSDVYVATNKLVFCPLEF